MEGSSCSGDEFSVGITVNVQVLRKATVTCSTTPGMCTIMESQTHGYSALPVEGLLERLLEWE